MSDERHSHEAHPRSLEERIAGIEKRLAAEALAAPERIVFVCPTCQARDTIVVDEAIEGAPLSTTAQIARLLRHELRHFVTTQASDRQGELPPFDWELERLVCAAAVLGIRWGAAARLSREHFFSPFFGLVWDLCRACEKVPHLPTIAAQMEAHRACEKRLALLWLNDLASPHTAAACNPAAVDRLLELSWQRALFYDAKALTGLVRQVSVGHRAATKGMLLDMLARLESGPEGDVFLAAIEKAVAEAGDDTSSPAKKARAKGYAKRRDLIFEAASVVGWLRAQDPDTSARPVARRMDTVLQTLEEALKRLKELQRLILGSES